MDPINDSHSILNERLRGLTGLANSAFHVWNHDGYVWNLLRSIDISSDFVFGQKNKSHPFIDMPNFNRR